MTYVKDFKSSNVENADKVLPGLLGVQLLVDALHHPQEHLLVNRFSQSANGVVDLTEGEKCWLTSAANWICGIEELHPFSFTVGIHLLHLK